jgi:hypothetical protein
VVQALLAAGADPNLITSGGDASVLGEVGTSRTSGSGRTCPAPPRCTTPRWPDTSGGPSLLAAKADVNRARPRL